MGAMDESAISVSSVVNALQEKSYGILRMSHRFKVRAISKVCSSMILIRTEHHWDIHEMLYPNNSIISTNFRSYRHL